MNRVIVDIVDLLLLYSLKSVTRRARYFMLINLNENISYFAQNISRSLLQIYNCILFFNILHK